MTQATTWGVPQTGPVTPYVMAQRMDGALDALLTAHRGTSRPAYATSGTIWAKIISGEETQLYYYDGADDIYLGKLDTTNNYFYPAALGTLISATGTEVSKLSGIVDPVVVIQSNEDISGATSFTITGLEAGKRYKLEVEVYPTAGSIDVMGLRFGNSGGVDSGANYAYVWLGFSEVLGASAIYLSATEQDAPLLLSIEFSTVIGDTTQVVGFANVSNSYTPSIVVGGFKYDGASAVDRLQIYRSTNANWRWRLIQTN